MNEIFIKDRSCISMSIARHSYSKRGPLFPIIRGNISTVLIPSANKPLIRFVFFKIQQYSGHFGQNHLKSIFEFSVSFYPQVHPESMFAPKVGRGSSKSVWKSTEGGEALVKAKAYIRFSKIPYS